MLWMLLLVGLLEMYSTVLLLPLQSQLVARGEVARVKVGRIDKLSSE